MAALGILESLDERIKANYNIDQTAGFASQYGSIPPLACTIYLLAIFSGKKWMEKRSPFRLRSILTLWNFLLAVFSISGFVIMVPPLVLHVKEEGYVHTVCNSPITTSPWLSFWAYLFVLSKIVEFGDTFFIVLRKTPLHFLHWYHHITVLLYSWHGLATQNTVGHWFCAINLGIHSVMYSYYMFKSMGFTIWSSIPKAITILQLAQFFIGLILALTGLRQSWGGHECGMNSTHIRAGFLMYGSYFILFLRFFYHRYIKAPVTKLKEQ